MGYETMITCVKCGSMLIKVHKSIRRENSIIVTCGSCKLIQYQPERSNLLHWKPLRPDHKGILTTDFI
jgi:RNase P subunit RPR2